MPASILIIKKKTICTNWSNLFLE